MERGRGTWLDSVLLLLPGVLLLVIAGLVAPATIQWHQLDLGIYAAASERLLQGQIPYKDFALEYPPLALLPFVVPRLLTFGLPLAADAYRGVFGFTNVLYSSAAALALAALMREWDARARRMALVWYALFVAIMAPLLPWRYDMFPALLTVCALLAVLRERPLLAGVLLGCGVASKLYPIVTLAAVGVFYLASYKWRALAWLALGSLVAVFIVMVPFFVLAPGEALSFLTYHEQRGLQIESLVGGMAMLAAAMHWIPARVAFNFGALHLQSPFAAVLPLLLPLFAGAMLIALWLWFRQFRREYQQTGVIRLERLIACVVSVLLIFMITNKVFSPQYLIWLLPFVPLLNTRQRLLFAIMAACTIALFPFWYERLLAFDLAPTLLLNLRNLLALAFIPWLLAARQPVALPRRSSAARAS